MRSGAGAVTQRIRTPPPYDTNGAKGAIVDAQNRKKRNSSMHSSPLTYLTPARAEALARFGENALVRPEIETERPFDEAAE